MHKQNVKYILLTANDIETVLYLQGCGQRDTNGTYYTPAEKILRNSLDSHLSYGVYDIDNKPIGMFLIAEKYLDTTVRPILYSENDCYYVAGVYVAPQYRRLGVAEHLGKQAISLLQDRGSGLIWTTIAPTNNKSIALFSKLGFQQHSLQIVYEEQIERIVVARYI